jgi:chorismate dehydratase
LIRLGVVSYLNALPLVEGLEHRPWLKLVPGPPSAVAKGLADGSLDVGLVPVVELLRQPSLVVVSDAAIAADDRVDSVLLLLRGSPADVRELVLDRHSRTSQILARVLLAEVWGVRPHLVEMDPRRAWEEGRGDAVLVIGDVALDLFHRGVPCLDLASVWWELTGLPFVFAVWAGHGDVVGRRDDLAQALGEARDRGTANVPAIARRAAPAAALPEDLVRVYLTDRIRYRLGTLERAGLDGFLQRARPFLSSGQEGADSCSTSDSSERTPMP